MFHSLPASIIPALLPVFLLASSLPAPAQTPADRLPIRIVPQIKYDAKGLVDPSGRFAVARSYNFRGIQIVDLKQQSVAWTLDTPPLTTLAGYAFSHDGNRLAICSTPAGQILDLAADRTTPAPWLNGVLPAFSPDDKLIYLAAGTQPASRLDRYVTEIQVYNLEGKLLRTFPLQMNIVSRIAFSDNAKTLLLDGGTGRDLESEAGGTFTPAQQTIDLDTGKSTFSSGTPQRDSRALYPIAPSALTVIPLLKNGLDQRFADLVWDPSSHAIACMGNPICLELWGLNELTFKKFTGKTGEPREVNLQSPGLLVGTAGYSYNDLPPELAALSRRPPTSPTDLAPKFVTLIQLPQGASKPIAIPSRNWLECLPSPDGRYLAGRIGATTQDSRVQIWDPKTSTLVSEIAMDKKYVAALQWTADSRFLVMLISGEGGGRRWEFFTPQGKSDGIVPAVNDYGVTFSPSGNLMALQAPAPKTESHTDSYRTSVRNSRTGEELATLDGGTSRATTFFLDDQRLVIAGGTRNPTVRLIRLNDRPAAPVTLWEIKKAITPQKISWQPGSSAIVLQLDSSGQAADILSLADGSCLPARAENPAWHQPTLLANGKLALDPLGNSTILHLKSTASGQTLATLAGFGESDWIIYTPDGAWTGSPDALRWTAFYRGTNPLPPEEITALRQPDKIKSLLTDALR